MVTHDPQVAERARYTLHLKKGALVEASRRKDAMAGGARMKYRSLHDCQSLSQENPPDAHLGSFAVALFLLALLAVVRGAFNHGVDVAGADRLVTINRTSLINTGASFLHGQDPADQRRDADHPHELVRRRLSGPEELFPQVRHRR